MRMRHCPWNAEPTTESRIDLLGLSGRFGEDGFLMLQDQRNDMIIIGGIK